MLFDHVPLLAWQNGPPIQGPVWDLLIGYLLNCPTFVMLVIGVILAIATWRRHAGVSALLLTGVALHAFTVGVSVLLFQLIPTLVDRGSLSPDAYLTAQRGVVCFGSVGHAVANLLLIVAALRGRDAPPP
jgi:hypothetical protein